MSTLEEYLTKYGVLTPAAELNRLRQELRESYDALENARSDIEDLEDNAEYLADSLWAECGENDRLNKRVEMLENVLWGTRRLAKAKAGLI